MHKITKKINKNNVIREKMYIEDSVLDYTRYKQLNWFGYVLRVKTTTKKFEVAYCVRLEVEEEDWDVSKFIVAGSNNWNEEEGKPQHGMDRQGRRKLN